MGKIQRGRQKYHHLAKAKSTNDLSSVGPSSHPSSQSLPTFSVSSNVFEGVEIPLNFNQSLREEDVRSIVTTKSNFKDPKLKKVERRALRREAFMTKLDWIVRMRQQEKERKKKQRAPHTCDMRTLADALPSLEEITTTVKTEQRQRNLISDISAVQRDINRQRSLPKAKQRQKNLMSDISAFRKVLNDPIYKTDPTGAISNYIQDKIKQEIMDEV